MIIINKVPIQPLRSKYERAVGSASSLHKEQETFCVAATCVNGIINLCKNAMYSMNE